MNRKSKTISYIDGFQLEGDVMVPVVKGVEIMMTGTKRFHNCLYLIMGLGKLERLLMDWISEEMDDRNIIRNDGFVRGQFINFISTLVIDGDNKVYKDQSVNNAFHSLCSSKLLISISKGIYQVNPNYYWSGSDKDRVDEIMMNIRFSTESTNFKVMPDGKSYNVSRKKK